MRSALPKRAASGCVVRAHYSARRCLNAWVAGLLRAHFEGLPGGSVAIQ